MTHQEIANDFDLDGQRMWLVRFKIAPPRLLFCIQFILDWGGKQNLLK
jgi:hypothetical protein